MANDILELCAYHESGRVVFAYLSGFYCESIELSDADFGRGKSVLNGGADMPVIQQIMSGNHQAASENKAKAIETAKKLMEIYVAGSCTRAYLEQLENPGQEVELDVPASDDKQIITLQNFLAAISPGFDPAYTSKCISQTFQKLKDPEIWKAIQSLTNAAAKSPERSLTRFQIEDALMAGGMKVKRPSASGFNVGVGDASRKSSGEGYIEPKKTEGPLSNTDILLSDFFRTIRTDWSEEEAQAAVKYVRAVIVKHGLK